MFTMEKLSIADFYIGRSIFVTGGTGFMGKVLVEKLLRSCPAIDRIYLLMRSSRGKNVDCRLQELIEHQIFSNVKKCQPNVMRKITAVEGDVTLPGFGLSESNLQLLIDNVSVVFNTAATVRFDEELKTAIQMNVKGPLHLLELSRRMKQLEAFVHVSTAFNNLDGEEIEEKVPHSTTDPIKLLELLDSLNDNDVKKMTKQLLGKCPNTYTYTKTLAEQLLEKLRGNIPLVIVRPSIVTAALHEPFPGWVDNLNGATGSIVAVGKGFFRVVRMNTEMVSDIIPVDLSINLMIALAWHTAITRPNGVNVFCSTTGHKNPITWGQLLNYTTLGWIKFPMKNMMWYPGAFTVINCTAFAISKFVLHYIPACLFDLYNIAVRKRTKWVKLYSKAHQRFALLEFFATNQWRFLSDNAITLLDRLSAEDRKTFPFDVRQIEWQSYFEIYVLGARRFVLKEEAETLPIARRNLKRLFLARLSVYFCFFAAWFLIFFRSFLLPILGLGCIMLIMELFSLESGQSWEKNVYRQDI